MMAGLYYEGKAVPRQEVLERLFRALEVPYKTLDDYLESIGDVRIVS